MKHAKPKKGPGRPVTTGTGKAINVYFPRGMVDEIDLLAAGAEMTPAAIVFLAVRDHLKRIGRVKK